MDIQIKIICQIADEEKKGKKLDEDTTYQCITFVNEISSIFSLTFDNPCTIKLEDGVRSLIGPSWVDFVINFNDIFT